MSKKTTNDNVRVMVRVRPFNQKELDEANGNPVCTLSCNSDTLIACIDPHSPDVENIFPFDCVFWSMPETQVKAGIPMADQLDVYKAVGVPQLDSMFEGYNGCIFAYGQTSSGKTHTMMGYEGHGRGVTPRLCEELFIRIAYKMSLPDDLKRTTYTVKVSYLEIYNEKVQDLLSRKSSGHDLKIVHDPKLGPVVKGLSEHVVTNWDEVNKLLVRGTETRTTAATAMNDTSSRSHAVVQISMDMEDSLGVVGQKRITRPRRSRANLVDLAGSEKIAKSKVEGANLKEAIGINQSLTCLGRVIDALVENKPHIPYRDSVLTCLLADSLGGNSRTTMVAALSPAAANYEETLSTLRYASRARKIVNKIKINEDPAAALIRELQEELSRMREGILGGEMSPGGTRVTEADVAERTAEVQEALAKLQELQAREEVAEQQREQKWESERVRIENKHQEEIERLRLEQDELEQQKVQLEERHQELREDLDVKRKMHIMDMFKRNAQISSAKVKKEQTIEQKKKLKHELIVSRFRSASQKARLQAAQEEAARAEEFRHRAEALELELQAARRRIEHLKKEPIRPQGEYDPQNLNDPRNPVRMAGMPTGEEVVYDGPLCDMCLEQPAQYRCLQPPCSGDVYCVWCDSNQHRRADKRKHKRQPLGAPCECCGARESEFVCPGCGDMRLCRTCDDHKHGAHQRSNIISVACDFCGLRNAEVACFDCPGKSCPQCDEVIHRATRRLNHRRRYHEFTPWDEFANLGQEPPQIKQRQPSSLPREPSRRTEQGMDPMFEPDPMFQPDEMYVAEQDPYYYDEPQEEIPVPFVQDAYHTYIPNRPAFKRLTGPERRAKPRWHPGSVFVVRDAMSPHAYFNNDAPPAAGGGPLVDPQFPHHQNEEDAYYDESDVPSVPPEPELPNHPISPPITAPDMPSHATPQVSVVRSTHSAYAASAPPVTSPVRPPNDAVITVIQPAASPGYIATSAAQSMTRQSILPIPQAATSIPHMATTSIPPVATSIPPIPSPFATMPITGMSSIPPHPLASSAPFMAPQAAYVR